MREPALERAQARAEQVDWPVMYGDGPHWIIAVDATPAGRLRQSRDRDGTERVVDLTLLPDFRGRGIGTFLLQRIQSDAHAEGRSVALHVSRGNPGAYRLYRSLGFVDDGGDDVMAALVSQPPSLMAEVRGLVWADPALEAELSSFTDPASFCDRVAEVAEHHGIALKADTVEWEIALGRRAAAKRWIL